MQRLEGRLVYAASDLTDYLECARLTELDALVARGELMRPDSVDPHGELLRRKGDEHEQGYLETMRARYPGEVVEFRALRQQHRGIPRGGATDPRCNAARRADHLSGDLLRWPVHRPRRLLAARRAAVGVSARTPTKSSTPSSGSRRGPITSCSFAITASTSSACRVPSQSSGTSSSATAKRRRSVFTITWHTIAISNARSWTSSARRERIDQPREYPLKRSHCAICPWDAACAKQRRDDDHLSLVASMRRGQIAKLSRSRDPTRCRPCASPGRAAPGRHESRNV